MITVRCAREPSRHTKHGASELPPVIVFAGLGIAVGGAVHDAQPAPRPVAAEQGQERGLRVRAALRDQQRTFRFGISFYMIAMLFILFDIEVVFLYPVGAILNDADSVFVLAEVLIFVSPAARRPRLRLAPGSPQLEVERHKLRGLAPARSATLARGAADPPAPRPRHAARRPRRRRRSRSTSSRAS